MLHPKPTGRNAAVRKYDLLTAMGAFALSERKGTQRLVLRLMTLVTARYNWRRDELSVGQREIARLWGVDQRTVKREMAKLRGMGWLIIKRQGARGRVSLYGMDIERIFETTRNQWPAVGPDFEQRLSGSPDDDGRVVPLHAVGSVPAPDAGDGSEWSLAKLILHSEDPSLYGAWFRALERTDRAGGRLTLKAPSRFHAHYVETRLAAKHFTACQSVEGDVDEDVVLH